MYRIVLTFALLAILYAIRDRLPIPLFRLPGDFEWRSKQAHLVIPLTTGLLVSLAVSFVFAVIGQR